MFSSCARDSVASGSLPRPAWHCEHPLVSTSPRELRTRPIQLLFGFVQKSLMVLSFPSFWPCELTICGAWPSHW
ncbi:MAG: hypothetical protein B7Z61_13945 [Acidobacteria bacterium 37-71-11]|nr:MAG: hypothetical protein B7Z61_13945 [Acidobacteria bacterium 37-71-11]